MTPGFSLVLFLADVLNHPGSLCAVGTEEREAGWISTGVSLPGVPVPPSHVLAELDSCPACFMGKPGLLGKQWNGRRGHLWPHLRDTELRCVLMSGLWQMGTWRGSDGFLPLSLPLCPGEVSVGFQVAFLTWKLKSWKCSQTWNISNIDLSHKWAITHHEICLMYGSIKILNKLVFRHVRQGYMEIEFHRYGSVPKKT